MSRKLKNSGFTLIEVLIVVVIMAVLAATIIPQFASSTNDAKTSSLKFNLHSMRSQIEVYKLQHNGTVPALTAGTLPGLIYATDVTGANIASTTSDATHPFGPYIQGGAMPANPFDGTTTITQISTFPPTATAGSGQGWLYEPVSGQLAPNTAGQLSD
jgi:prepilin-type N-terminal cleavage/methylation domain-containing protein